MQALADGNAFLLHHLAHHAPPLFGVVVLAFVDFVAQKLFQLLAVVGVVERVLRVNPRVERHREAGLLCLAAPLGGGKEAQGPFGVRAGFVVNRLGPRRELAPRGHHRPLEQLFSVGVGLGLHSAVGVARARDAVQHPNAAEVALAVASARYQQRPVAVVVLLGQLEHVERLAVGVPVLGQANVEVVAGEVVVVQAREVHRLPIVEEPDPVLLPLVLAQAQVVLLALVQQLERLRAGQVEQVVAGAVVAGRGFGVPPELVVPLGDVGVEKFGRLRHRGRKEGILPRHQLQCLSDFVGFRHPLLMLPV